MACVHLFQTTGNNLTCIRCGLTLTKEQWEIWLGQRAGDATMVHNILYPREKDGQTNQNAISPKRSGSRKAKS